MVLVLSGVRERLKSILSSMRGRVVTPGDVVALTGLPRYEVLAAFHVLEALGFIEVVHAKGNYKIYKLSDLGERLLEALEEAEEFMISIGQTQLEAEASA